MMKLETLYAVLRRVHWLGLLKHYAILNENKYVYNCHEGMNTDSKRMRFANCCILQSITGCCSQIYVMTFHSGRITVAGIATGR
jgi:hypothetical protein